MNNAAILMTALPTSLGHIQLVCWASEFGFGEVTALVCGRENDPIPLQDRYEALVEATADLKNVNVISVLHDYPDYPEQFDGTVEEFDRLWTDKLHSILDLDSEDFLVASDIYGSRFADNLGVKFAPFDPDREIVKISGTKIRREPFKYFSSIAPGLQRKLRKTITIFGSESCGKTTISKKLAERYNAPYVPEWARPYLESLGSPAPTDDRMAMIVRGQLASQRSSQKLLGSPFIFQDTDLFSTLGYYRIYQPGIEKQLNMIATPYDDCEIQSVINKSDLYIVMNSNIRFVPDSLRYGIDKRESDDQFWLNICEEFGLNYYYVKSTNPHAQEEEVQAVIEKFFLKENPVFGFERV